MKKTCSTRRDNKHFHNYNLPSTKLRNVYCTHCKHQFFLREFVPLQGVVPLLLECGHVICEKCTKVSLHKPCPLCNMVSQYEDYQNASLPLNMYALGLMVVSHNRPMGVDDADDISFSKPVNSKMKQNNSQVSGLCHECGIPATIRCPQCNALYCFVCYSKIHGRALQNHSKIILPESNSENSFIIRNTCSERCNESLGYYCEHCQIAGCSHCMLRLHNKHNYVTLESKNQLLLSEFYKIQERVTESLQRVHQAQKKLKSTALYPTKMQNADSVEAAITQHFAYLHGVLQNVERKITDTLHRQRDSRSKNIDEISVQLKNLEDRLHSALVVTASMEENLDKINIEDVISKLQELADIPCHLIVNSVPEDQEIRFKVDESIVTAMEKHCSIQVPTVSSFSLQRTEQLPENYEMEPLTEEINISGFKLNTSMKTKSTSRESVIPERSDNLPAVGSSEMIRVTHVNDPSCFHVQLVQNQSKIAELKKELAILANINGIIPIEITLNALYVVQCAKDRAWYRGRIIEKRTDANGDEKYTVLFIDYGMKEENVPLSRIRHILPNFSMVPVLSLRCTLFDVVPNHGKWHPDATQAFKKLVCTNAMVSMYIMMITGDTYYVELCVISSQDSGLISVKDSLTYMKYATCVSPNKLMKTNPDSTKQYYKEQLELEYYVDVQILFVESPSSIYVQKTHANRSYFSTLIHEMTQYYEQNLFSSDLYLVPQKDTPCAARGVNGFWHRALIREVTENTVKVFYVDLGYTLILSYDAVRSLPKKFMSCRTQAIKVSLRNIKPADGSKQWNEETNEFLKKFLMDGKNFKIIAFQKLGDVYSVVMYTNDKMSVIHLLVKKGLVQNIGSSPKSENVHPKQYKSKPKRMKGETPKKPYDTLDTNISNKSKSEDTEDPFKVCVTVHHAESPDCIYVSDATSDHSNINQMITEMQNFYRKFRSEKREVWNENTVCAVFSPKSNMYYRGRIINIKSMEKILVFLYDLGIEETVTINNIQSLYPPFYKVPTHVFKIKLTGILPCGGSTSWPSLSCEKLCEIIDNNHNCKCYISKLEDEEVMEDATIPVELWIKQVKLDGPLAPTRIEINSVNRMLVEQGVALPMKEYVKKRDKILAVELKRQLIKKLERLSRCELNVKWLKIDEELNDSIDIIDKEASQTLLHNSDSNSENGDCNPEEIFDNIPSLSKLTNWLPPDTFLENSFIAIPTYLDDSGYLYLHSKVQNAKTLQRIESKLEELYGNSKIESCDTVWAAEDLCIAQYHVNNKWYRGKVVRVLDNETINVKFIDYGNTEECSIGTIKKKVVLENIPTQCTKCSIYGLQPNTTTGKWITEDLDKIHNLLIGKECRVTILDSTVEHPIISVMLLPNEHCTKKCDLLLFLTKKWGMNIIDTASSASNKSVSTTDTAYVLIEDSKSVCLDMEAINDIIISGSSVLHQRSDLDLNTNESCIVTDDNLSWGKVKDEIITSTPFVISEENLSTNYKLIDIPQDTEFIEIELCCSITASTFYAQLKENAHSPILNSYYTQYELLMEELQQEANKQPSVVNIVPNTPCCAQFNDGLWYRCLIMETESIKDTDNIEIKLLFIDFGNDEYRTVNPEQCNLYVLKKEWIELPAMAVKCKLWNIAVPVSVDHNNLLTQLEAMYNKRVIATVKEIDEDFMNIELHEDETCTTLLYNKLLEEGLFELKSKTN